MLRLRPIPWRIGIHLERLRDIDDTWRLDAVELSPTSVRLVNTTTGHVVELKSDNVVEWRSPDFLMLRCQLKLRADGLDIEPIFRGTPITPTSPDASNQERRALTADEVALLKHVASQGGAVTYHSESHTDAGLTRIRFEHALGSLRDGGFITQVINSRETRLFPCLELTPIARQWSIDNGLA